MAPAPAAQQAAAAARPVVLAEQLCAVMIRLHQKGWCEGTGGNFSCVLQRDPLLLLMAPSGVDKGSVVPEQLLLVDGQGMVVQGQGKASAETLLHLEIVQHTEAGAVLHTHSQAATLLSARQGAACSGYPEASAPNQHEDVRHVEHHGLEMLKGLRGVHSHESRVRVPVLANDQDLNRLSAQASPHLQTAPHGLLIAGHGLYAWGADLREALRHTEIHEFLLEQAWRRQLLEAWQRLSTPGEAQP